MHALKASPEDRRFLAEFESCALTPADLTHRAHVRLAYTYLVDGDVESAAARMRAALIAFLRHHRIDPTKYHETMTRAWILAVRHFMTRTTEAASADAFMASCPILLDSRIMLTHYSVDLLHSDRARGGFVEPDLTAIPRHDSGTA